MDPVSYLDLYHRLTLNDPLLGIAATIDMQNYISGMPSENMTEMYHVLGGLAARLKLKTPAAVIGQTQPFHIKGYPDQIDPLEEWFIPSLRRAYGGRASPHEFRDAIRLAVFTKRTKPLEVAAYVKKWFGLDCNAFVGNWLGVSPSTAIFAYALGYGTKEKLLGATPDVYTTRDIVKLPPVATREGLKQGNVLCTFGSKDKRGLRWRHIALVQDIKLVSGDRYRIWLAEWGQKGNIEKHRTAPSGREITLREGKLCAELPKAEGLFGFDGKDPDGEPAVRLFFDSTGLDWLASRDWHVGGLYGT